MITLKTATFFDAKKLIQSVDRATRKALSRAGAFVRKRARYSIRKRKKVSAPGKPPSSHAGNLRTILFAYDAATRSVVIGPMVLNKQEDPPIPNLLEFGGRAVRRRKGGKRKTLRYRPRPFMGPALEAELAKGGIPKQFRNAVSTSG